MTIFLTIISGVLIFVIGQVIQKFIIEPIYQQKQVIGNIADSLIFYANIYSNPIKSKDKRYENASKKLRELSTQLTSKTYLIPFYNSLSKLKIVKNKNVIKEVHKKLLLLSNRLYTIDGIPSPGLNNADEADKIALLLNIIIK
ncbi:MAG: hypothetical protein WCV92_02810 [Candidatus Buchananbacteria bacterium]